MCILWIPIQPPSSGRTPNSFLLCAILGSVCSMWLWVLCVRDLYRFIFEFNGLAVFMAYSRCPNNAEWMVSEHINEYGEMILFRLYLSKWKCNAHKGKAVTQLQQVNSVIKETLGIGIIQIWSLIQSLLSHCLWCWASHLIYLKFPNL